MENPRIEELRKAILEAVQNGYVYAVPESEIEELFHDWTEFKNFRGGLLQEFRIRTGGKYFGHVAYIEFFSWVHYGGR